jgi:hypothetical protein
MGNTAGLTSDWYPVVTAPPDVELELSIYDKGQYHALAFPCRREGKGWRDIRAKRFMLLSPTHWRLWERKPEVLDLIELARSAPWR